MMIRLFQPFGDIVMAKANQAIASMNGYPLEGRVIAVRVAGKPPPPAVASEPPTHKMPAYPGQDQAIGGYASQQFTSGGPLPNPPHSAYMVAPVPWGPPPPCALYAPPPPGANMYNSVQVRMECLQIPHTPPPPPPPNYPYYYVVPPPPVSHSVGDHSQNMAADPWASNPPVPPPVSSAEQTSSGVEAEYEKFIGDLK
ncbi:hypothetical protein C5167_002234 [Papaver somniferum]|uniref:RRM domain-containing protein n=1 Tax=Papaver somniferum TaxID=3469 RepID=A0A4Y7L1I3_PAPSO|nr:hypothetical protein C5167_002234 [Papaver somniferum]